jgi:integrase
MRIEKFLGIYPKKNTVGVYKAGIYDFFDCLYGKVRKGSKVTKEETAAYENLAEKYFTEGRDYFEDLLKFAAYMTGKPPTGARAKITGVMEFLRYYDVEFTERQRKQLSTKLPKGKMSRTAEKDIDTETLKRILTHMDLKGKAATLVLASSGMRIGELFQVKLSDIDLTTTPPEIVVRGENTKSGDTRTVFISTEAKEALGEWLKVRDQYLESAKDRNKGLVEKGIAKEKTIIDDRLFPFTEVNFREVWENALTKADLWNKDNSTGRSQIRVHALRKFFRSQLALSCPVDIVEALMGHEGYLTDAYRRYTRKQMGEYYLRAEHHVTVTGTGDIREIQDRLQDTQAAVKGYKDIITEQTQEIAELKQKYGEQEKKIVETEKVQERIKELEEELREVVNWYNKFMEDPAFYGVLLEIIKEVFNEFVKIVRESLKLKGDFKGLDLKIDTDVIFESVMKRRFGSFTPLEILSKPLNQTDGIGMRGKEFRHSISKARSRPLGKQL